MVKNDLKMLLAGVVMVLAANGWAAREVVDGIEWQYVIENGGAVVQNEANQYMPPIPNSTSGDIIIPDTLGGCPVKVIGTSAFSGCSGLTSVTIPATVTHIGISAFKGCSQLADVRYLGSVKSWCEMNFPDKNAIVSAGPGARDLSPWSTEHRLTIAGEEIQDLVIPNDVTRISNYAFYKCGDLTSVSIPTSLTNIGVYAFKDCMNLTSLTIPSGVVLIDDSAFWGCSNLTNLHLPSSVKEIGYDAFWGCNNLTYINHIGSVESWCEIDFKNARSNPCYFTHRLMINNNETTDLSVPNSVSRIGNYAFYACSNLTRITISEGVTAIGDYAFYGCSQLTEMTIPDSVVSVGVSAIRLGLGTVTDNGLIVADGWVIGHNSALSSDLIIEGNIRGIADKVFYDCDNLMDVTIRANIPCIGHQLFSDCANLKSVTLPDSVTCIGSNAFYYCSSLTNIVMSDNVTNIGNNAFSMCSSLVNVVLPSKLEVIGSNAFSACHKLVSLTIPRGVKVIGASAFHLCDSLTGNIDIPDGVTNIEGYTFYRCNNLSSVTLPNGLHDIGNYAFYECRSLTEIDIPSTVTNIGDYAFQFCYKLSSAPIPTSLTKIGIAVFDGCHLTNMTFHSGITNIGIQAFRDCDMSNLSIPNSVRFIGDYAFSGCESLTTVTIPDGIETIKDGLFNNCIKLKDITLPESVTNIGYMAFYGCSSLEEIVFEGLPPAVGALAFASVDPECRVSYLSKYREDWLSVIDEDGCWQGLKMQMVGEEGIVVIDRDGRSVVIETSWFEDQAEKLNAKFGSRDWASVAEMATGKTDADGKALTVLHDYIAGTDPTDEEDKFHAIITIGADGKPVITWHPALNDNETHKGVKDGVRSYKVFGNADLSADGWMEVEQDVTGDWRHVDKGEIVSPQFFKVSVAMP